MTQPTDPHAPSARPPRSRRPATSSISGMWLAALGVLLAPQAAQPQSGVSYLYLDVIRIHDVPPPPSGEYWDGSIIENLFRFSLTGIYPDLELCVGSEASCSVICIDAQLHADDPALATVCGLEITGGVAISEFRAGQRRNLGLFMSVREVDESARTAPSSRRPIADFRLFDPASGLLLPEECTATDPCTVPTRLGPLLVSFETSLRGVLGEPVPETAPAQPTAGGEPEPSFRLPTREEIEQALRELRDADRCTPGDRFFPGFNRMQFGSGPVAERRYQLATLITAIEDRETKDRLARAARQRDTTLFDDNTFTLILGDAERARQLSAMTRELATEFAASLVAGGLSRLVPTLPSEIDQMILEKLTTEPLAKEAVDLMFNQQPVTAECVMNELMKRNLIDRVQ